MKVISLTQPWASLWVFRNHKVCETRSWPSYTNGPIFVHATRECDKAAYERFRNLLPYASIDDVPLSALVGAVWLSRCYTTQQFIADRPDPWKTGYTWERERTVGDFTPGRFAWYTSDRERFGQVELLTLHGALGPLKGKQGIWEMPKEWAAQAYVKMLFRVMKQRAIERGELKL